MKSNTKLCTFPVCRFLQLGKINGSNNGGWLIIIFPLWKCIWFIWWHIGLRMWLSQACQLPCNSCQNHYRGIISISSIWSTRFRWVIKHHSFIQFLLTIKRQQLMIDSVCLPSVHHEQSGWQWYHKFGMWVGRRVYVPSLSATSSGWPGSSLTAVLLTGSLVTSSFCGRTA